MWGNGLAKYVVMGCANTAFIHPIVFLKHGKIRHTQELTSEFFYGSLYFSLKQPNSGNFVLIFSMMTATGSRASYPFSYELAVVRSLFDCILSDGENFS